MSAAKRGGVWAVVLLAVAAALRVPGIFAQPWLDEIWSMNLARGMSGPVAIFTSIYTDNNHWLNTLWLYVVRNSTAWWPMHLLALASGIATPALGYVWARRSGGLSAGIAAAVLLGFNDALIEYSSEARGYAPAACCAAGAVLAVSMYLRRPTWRGGVALALVWTLGVLSHLSFVGVWLATALAVGVGLARQWRSRRGRDTVLAIIAPLALPALVLGGLWWMELRHLDRGEGPPTATHLAALAAGDLLGVPLAVALPVGIVVFAAGVWQIVRLARAGDDLWIAFAAILLLVPVFLWVVPRTEYLHPRYLLVALAPTLMLLSLLAGNGFDRGRAWRWVGAGLLGVYVLSNVTALWPFLRMGRGQYLEGAAFVAEHSRRTGNGSVVVGCDDHPFATNTVLKFDWPYLGQPPRLVISPPDDMAHPPRWMVLEGNVGQWVMDRGAYYSRRASFRSGSALSGISWTLYERER